MGAEFLSRTRPTIRKHIDRKRVALATPDMLTKTPKDQPRCSIASPVEGAVFQAGEKLIIEARDGKLSARRGHTVVARFDNPGNELVAAIAQTGGVAKGVVRRIQRVSRKLEVSVQ